MVAIPSILVAYASAWSLASFATRGTLIRGPKGDDKPMLIPSAVRREIEGVAPPPPPSRDPFSSILGPVVQENFPDPSIIHQDGISYAFATNNRGLGSHGYIHIQVASSIDNQTWTLHEGVDALPKVGAWETGLCNWAPDVIQLEDGTFVLYYAGEPTQAHRHHCIGAATSKTITGPYTPLDTPFACPDLKTQGGAIDPDGFLDPSTGRRYVTYKVDGNSIGHGGLCLNTNAPIVPTPILLQEVDATNGLTLIGDPIEILDRDAADGPLIEAPSLHRSAEGIYFLFYASSCFATPLYKTWYATAPSITGPYTRNTEPLLVSGNGPHLIGPGGLDIIKDGTLIVFHGHLIESNLAGNLAELKDLDPTKRAINHVARSTPIPGSQSQHHPPLIRGMYSAIVTFSGLYVTLTGPIPGP